MRRPTRARAAGVTLAVLMGTWTCLLAFSSTPAHADAPRVLLVGDSNIFGALGITIERSLESMGYEVKRRGKPTSGLARPDFFDWEAEADDLLDRYDPDLVIMMFGGNDGQGLSERGGGARIKWKQADQWRAEYERRLESLFELLRAEGRRVIVLSPTNRCCDKARKRMARVRELQKEVAERLERVSWVDMFPLSSDAEGNWLKRGIDERKRRVLYRRGDGIHLTREGGREVGRRLIRVLMHLGIAAHSDR